MAREGGTSAGTSTEFQGISRVRRWIVGGALTVVAGLTLWNIAVGEGIRIGREQMEPAQVVSLEQEVYHTPDGERLPLWRVYPSEFIGSYPLLVQEEDGDFVNIDIRSQEDIRKFHRQAVRNRRGTMEYFEGEIDSLEQTTETQVDFLRARLDTLLREHTAMESTMIYEHKGLVENLKTIYRAN